MKCQVAVFAILALCLHQGQALKCYQCTSASEPKCADPFDTSLAATECTPDFMKEASGMLKGAAEAVNNIFGKVGIDTNINVPDANAAFACVKAVKQDGDKRVVVRSCSVPKNDKFDMCTQLKAQGGALVTYCESCEGDNCNAASGVTPSSLLMMLGAALSAYLVLFKQ